MKRIRNWHLITWLVALTWLAIFIWGHWPIWHEYPKNEPVLDLRGHIVIPSESKADPSYLFTGISGWPIECTYTQYPLQRIYAVDAFKLLGNTCFLLFNIISIAYIFQNHWSRISINFMFVLTTVSAMFLASLPHLFSDMTLTGFHVIMKMLYLSPLVVAIYYWFYGYFTTDYETKNAG